MGDPYHCFNEITDRQDAATTAKRWGMSKRRVLQLCNEGKVYAAKKIDGEWTIPTVALRPIDGRQHRGFVTPRHLKNILRYADAVVRDVPESERKWSRDAYEYFMRGSAFHLHTLETSHLNFGDVCQVLKGNAVAGKPLNEQMDVVYHQRATSFLCFALEEKRRFSVKLVEELHGLLACGDKYQREPMKERERVEESVKRIRTLKGHPIYLAADFMVRFLVLKPYSEHNERTAYLAANFILMSNGYPPIIIYRAVFKWWRAHGLHVPIDDPDFGQEQTTLAENWGAFLDETIDLSRTTIDMRAAKSHTPLDPTVFVSLFAKSIRRSCHLGLMRAIPRHR